MKNLNIFLFGLTLLLSSSLFAQTISYDQEYLLAKNEFVDGNFSRAATRFKSLLVNDPANEKSAYAAFYLGVATYNLEQVEAARDIFQDLVKSYKEWDKITEAQLWLAKIYFELDNPIQGVYHTELASRDVGLSREVNELKNVYYSELDSVSLRSVLGRNMHDTVAAHYLAKWQVNTPAQWRNTVLLDSLIRNYQLDSTELGLTPPADIFREKYKVAVLLPLFTNRLWHSGIYLQKSLAVEIYEGIQLALEEFDPNKISVEVFDTKMESTITRNMIESGQLKDADAIIGPLFPATISVVSEYSKEKKINFLNPVSANSEIIADNPYAFMLRSSAESIGELVAEYTKANIDTGAFAVYYGPRSTDSLTAYNYSASIQADSFHLAIRQRTSTADARKIFDSLTRSVQVIDTMKLRQMIRNGDDIRFKPLRDSLLLKVDSLNHIFIASDNQAIASEVMSAIAYRGDTTQLIGVGNWFSVPNAGLDLLESLNVWLAMQEFENMISPDNLRLSQRYRERYRQQPSKYVFYGYYAMKFLGNSLLNYGVYFQNGYKYKGNLDPRFDFRHSQDNQNLVLYRLKDGQPVLVPKRQIMTGDR